MITKQQLEQQLIGKAVKDPEFRKRLIEDPKAVIEQEMETELPGSLCIKILEESPGILYVVLPPLVARPEETETSEHELERIAGGALTEGCTVDTCVLACTADCTHQVCTFLNC